ncbi:MAG: hypothetical protein M3N28_08420 [Actinomycetota bacterium]|nr:hypothetical protein [Actinomycetota bacterium]
MERFVVGTVLLLAGAFKLAHRAWPRAAAELGAPRWVIGALPWLELALGALLLAGVGGRWTAGSACALLALFTAAVAIRLRLGTTAPCGCFGETSAEPLGVDTLVRNVVLTLVAAMGVVRDGDAGPASVVAGVGVGLLIVVASRVRLGTRRWASGRR